MNQYRSNQGFINVSLFEPLENKLYFSKDKNSSQEAMLTHRDYQAARLKHSIAVINTDECFSTHSQLVHFVKLFLLSYTI